MAFGLDGSRASFASRAEWIASAKATQSRRRNTQSGKAVSS